MAMKHPCDKCFSETRQEETRFCTECVDKEIYEAYNRGYNQGFKEGHVEGYTDGVRDTKQEMK